MPTHPGLDRALQFLTILLETHSGESLPSVTALAQKASVSYVTMRRAVASLRKRGVIAPRGRLRQAGTDLVAPVEEARRVWKSVARTIERNVLESANVSETLGSIKELCARYGVCHRTMVRSLEQLRANGLLERRGRRWAVMRATPAGSMSTVVVFLRGTGTGIFVYPVRTWEYLRILESECSRAGIAVEPCTLEYSGRSLNVAGALRRFETIRSRSAVLGAMVWTMGLGAFNAASFLTRLQRYGQPISVLDEVNRVSGDIARRLSGVRLLRVAFGEHAGLNMGRHLTALGHRTIGFVSHVPLDSYALIRLRGLRKACAQAGLSADTVRVVAPARSAGDIADPPDTNVLSPPLLRRLPFPRQPSELRPGFGEMQPDQDLLRYQRFLPLMGAGIEQALGDGVVTALVCVSDELAMFCLDFLAALGRAVPSDISVVGFDDTLEATRRRLTSYNFNNYAVVRACLDHILNPRAKLHTGHAPLDLDGYVVKRASSGAARGAGGVSRQSTSRSA